LLDGQGFSMRGGQAARTASPEAPREDRPTGDGDKVATDLSTAVAAKLDVTGDLDLCGSENVEAGSVDKRMLISDPPDRVGTPSGTKEVSWRVDRAGGGRSAGEPRPLLEVPLRFVGVVGRLYAVLESDQGMVLMDQHAAHERVLFEDMLARMQQGSAPSQRLLLPETVELAVRDARFLRDHLGALTRLGVGLSEFGERTFMLDALPPFVRASEPRRFVLELIDSLQAAGEDVNSHRLGEDVVAKTVCRHAVKANDALAPEELEHLVKQLRECQMPYTCPHGRPTLIEMSYRELEKKFGRSGLSQ
jgi:DNA mismatch repair protein MutL